jgi:hypothetical protein
MSKHRGRFFGQRLRISRYFGFGDVLLAVNGRYAFLRIPECGIDEHIFKSVPCLINAGRIGAADAVVQRNGTVDSLQILTGGAAGYLGFEHAVVDFDNIGDERQFEMQALAQHGAAHLSEGGDDAGVARGNGRDAGEPAENTARMTASRMGMNRNFFTSYVFLSFK